jgi:hypothetical protein
MLRLLLPLVIRDEQFYEGLAIMEAALEHALAPAAHQETMKVSHA